MATRKGKTTTTVPEPQTNFSPEVRGFVRSFVRELKQGNAAIFAGAGLSVPRGYVNWKELLRTVADELGLDVDRETNLVALAQFHVNEHQNRTTINQRIIDEFNVNLGATENHEILARLPIQTYWTTNYDPLIENALRDANRIVDVKYEVRQLKNSVLGRDATVYKMHGDALHPDEAIITKDDYEGYFREHELFVTKLSSDLVDKTFLFLGFSFSDPNIDYVMSRVRVTLRKSPKQHYCIIRRESRQPRESAANFDYRKRQQSYFVKDLARVGIRALMIDKYEEITQILHAVESAYRSATVLVSGSASEYGPDWTTEEAGRFLAGLSGMLIEERRRVLTGFGIGVGPAIIGGALEVIVNHPKRYGQNQLVARPFPVGTASPAMLQKVYREHRERMAQEAGIAIFVFGNKRGPDGTLVDADGVIEEFLAAQQAQCRVIPIGATGFVARQLWEGVMKDFTVFYPNASPTLRRSFERLGAANATPTDLLADIRTVVQALGEP